MIMNKDNSERNVNSRGSNGGKDNIEAQYMHNPEIRPNSNRNQPQPSSSPALLMQ
jgi:hypothetical protein